MIESAHGKMDNIVAFRLPPGTDVMAGIMETCEKYDIKNGVIISGLGSWRKAAFCIPVDLPDGTIGYSDPTVMEGDYYELVGLSGIICHDNEGNILPHIHLTICDRDGRVYGGHMDTGCEVLITTDVVIGTFTGINMGRQFNEEVGFPLFSPTKEV